MEHRTIFIYLFIYLLDTTLQHLGFNVFSSKYWSCVKIGGSLNMLLIET